MLLVCSLKKHSIAIHFHSVMMDFSSSVTTFGVSSFAALFLWEHSKKFLAIAKINCNSSIAFLNLAYYLTEFGFFFIAVGSNTCGKMQGVSSVCPLKEINSASVVPGKEGVKPSTPLSNLKSSSAEQCAHACHAVVVFFRGVTFHLYLKTPDACQFSLSFLAIHPLLSVGTLMKYAFIKTQRCLLIPSTDEVITRWAAGEPAADSTVSLLWVSSVIYRFSSTCMHHC